ncbi:MAG: hypothetical protein ACHQ3P_00520 [Candidatus Limnocylindrales bacterium]
MTDPAAVLEFRDGPPDRPGSARGDDLTVILDPSWTPRTKGASEPTPLHECFSAALDARDLFGEALDLVDRWASATGVADLLVVEGVSYWFRVREEAWNWVHERLLWRYAFDRLGDVRRFGAVVVPATEPALVDVARSMGLPVEVAMGGGAAAASDSPVSPAAGRRVDLRSIRRIVPKPLRSSLRRVRPRSESPAALERHRQDAFLADRWQTLSRLPAPRLLVLTLPRSYQRVGPDPDGPRRDPNLSSVIEAAHRAGLEPILVGWDMNRASAEDWELLEQDPRLVPSYLVHSRWGHPDDSERAAVAAASVLDRMAQAGRAPLLLEDTDVGPQFMAALRTSVERTVAYDMREFARVERFMAEVGPAAILMTQEHHRMPWLLAGHRAGVPTFAVQHGILYRTHPGYPPTRGPGVLLPTRTFVFGDYARHALLAGAYLPEEVEVSGSPRLDAGQIAASSGAPKTTDASGESGRVRSSLGVSDDDRLLVISTVNAPYIRRSHVVHMIVRLLDGPLPRVHLVFKQHPGELDEGPYRALIAGLAAAGGYDPPPVTVVRDVDLYQLLAAADAHLGLHSTVLTDAVVAGTPNLIAIVEGKADMLGYVAAGVAVPVRDLADVRTALADPPRADPDARRAFLSDHFRPGDASARIVGTISGMTS